MGILFSKSNKKQSRITEQDKAILQLKQQRDKLKQYQKKVKLNLERERQVARELLKNGKKDRALLMLKKKKFQEQMLDKTDNQLENLEKMVSDIEFSQIEVQVIEGLKVGNESLKKMHEILSVEEVERIMDETQEGIAKQKEIDELISGTFSEEDNRDIEAELDSLIAAALPDVQTEATSNLPDVPETIHTDKEADNVKLPDVPENEPTAEAKERSKEKVLVAA